ncbi:MAG: hypothetical protein H0X17_20200, partial [Deltaproteobacteria bacterium]|nr:hypothetical protein [Deltaproteobacteria bacterium]
GTPFSIEFTNPLDDDRFDESQLAISPPIPGVKIVQSGNYLSIAGLTTARTTYKVVVSGGLLDAFGQALGKDTTLTFRVTDARPTFFGPSGMVVVDPGGKRPTLDFFSTNYEQLKVQLFQVTPKDYDAYGNYQRNQWDRTKRPAVPGTKVFDGLVKIPPGANALVETSVDLTPAMKGGVGHVIAIVEPYPWKERHDPPRLISWVQSTKLAVDAYVDADQLVAYASELATGKPASGVSLELAPFGIQARTDAQGLAKLALRAAATAKGSHYLIARRGNDVAFVGDDQGYWSESGTWVKQARPSHLAWYVIDDRKIYKPGEEVTLKGWLRVIDPGKGGDVGGLAGAVSSLAYTVKDSRGNQIGKGSMPVSAVGGFDTKFTLPPSKAAPNLGYAHVAIEAQGRLEGSHHHSFQVEEFRRPEFEVTAQASQGPFLVGGAGDVTVNAKYFAGGPLAAAPVNWNVSASQTTYTPPNRDDYVFGAWKPWWGYHRWDGGGDQGGTSRSWSLAAKTDATGAHTMHLDFLSAKPAMPMAVTTHASVTDVNRQTWSAAAALIVHPAALYVGLKTKQPFVEQGQPFDLEVIGVDLDGKAAPGAKIELRTVRLDWEYKRGTYTQQELDPQLCSVVAAAGPVACQLTTTEGGTYQVTATIVDARGRANQTKLDFWVTGGAQPPAREIAQERVGLIPDRKEYRGGDVAELLVQSPFSPAEGVVTWRRNGIVKTERIALTGPTTLIKVPVTDAMVPNLTVQVDLVGAAARLDDRGGPDPKLPKRPAYAVGSIDLPVPPKQRTLAVEITPSAAKIGPGEAAKLALVVRDAAGRPVANADAAVIVVDEAILALTGYTFPDPVATFYGHRGTDTRDHYLRAHVKLAKPDAGLLASGGGGVAADAMTATAAPMEMAPGAPPPPPK